MSAEVTNYQGTVQELQIILDNFSAEDEAAWKPILDSVDELLAIEFGRGRTVNEMFNAAGGLVNAWFSVVFSTPDLNSSLPTILQSLTENQVDVLRLLINDDGNRMNANSKATVLRLLAAEV